MILNISSKHFWNEIQSKFGQNGGVYKVLAYDGANPQSISRVLGVDQQGTLYIGKADSFLDRVINLKKSTDPKYVSSNHEFGVRYKGIIGMSDKFKYNDLRIELIKSQNPKELEKMELGKYIETFGELPPLNRQG